MVCCEVFPIDGGQIRVIRDGERRSQGVVTLPLTLPPLFDTLRLPWKKVENEFVYSGRESEKQGSGRDDTVYATVGEVGATAVASRSPSSSDASSTVWWYHGSPVSAEVDRAWVHSTCVGEGDGWHWNGNWSRPVEMHQWLSTEGGVTRAHYDAYDNVFMQVVGHKEAALWSHARLHNRSSSCQSVLPLAPHMSPQSRQVAATVDRERCPPDVLVVLAPGDMLHIPAMVLHEFSVPELRDGVTVSYSLNAWTESPASLIFDDALRLPLPLEEEQLAQEVGATILARFLTVIASRLGLRHISDELDALLAQRHGMDVTDPFSSSACASFTAPAPSPTLPPPDNNKIRARAAPVAAALASTRPIVSDAGAKTLFFDYVEELAFFVGGADISVKEVLQCLRWMAGGE